MCIEFARMFGAQLRGVPSRRPGGAYKVEGRRERWEGRFGRGSVDAAQELKAQGNKEFKAGNFNEAIGSTQRLERFIPRPKKGDPHRA